MFKLTLKVLTLTLLLSAGLLFISGGRASAALADNCAPWAPGSNWGNHDGAGGGKMSSLVVHAVDSSTGNAPLNTQYILNSQDPNHPGNPDLQKRIFDWPIGNGRTDHHPFNTGEHLSGNGSGGYNCNGWSVLGTGADSQHIGNGWVIDCGALGQESTILFWISHVDNPGGAPGRWRLIDNGVVKSQDVNSDTSPYRFNAENGGTEYLTLQWVPAPTTGGGSGGTCQRLDVSLSGSYFGHNKRAHVVVNQVTNGRVKINSGPWQGGTGGNIDENIPSDLGGTGSYEKEYAYQPQANSITVTVTVEYHDSSGWHNVPGPNNPNYIRDTTQPCFTASCSISYVDGDGPGGIVLVNGRMHIHGVYYNTSPSPDDLPIWSPGLSASGSQNPSNNHGYTLWSSPPPAYKNWAYGFDIYMTAPSNVTTDNFSLTPVYFNGGAIGGACSGGVSAPIYEPFTLEPHANLTYNTAENPGNIGYSTYIQNNSSQAISAPTTSSFKFTPYSGGAGCPSVGPVNSNGPYNPGGPNYTISPATCNPSSVDAGDQYCSQIDLTSYNQGWVGPGGSLVGVSLNGSASDKKCFTVTNEPYFKVYGGSISAGGDFSTNGDGKCTGGGLLAGWNDNVDSVKRGAGSQLSALALIKITGFASAQASAPTSSPPGTALTFANTEPGDITSDKESPSLGGNFDPGGSHCLPDVKAKSGTVVKNGPYTQPGASGINSNISVFVNGDVRITDNITYSGSWSINNVPSFVLHATGNIYIDPGVTQLDGTYISNKTIYTCGNGFTPVSASAMFNGCNNQLTVYGSFIADQINFIRTFGSLRDEQSSPLRCSHAGTTSSPRKTCAAEVIDFSPELFLSTPDIQPPSNGATQYDAITSLPPVL